MMTFTDLKHDKKHRRNFQQTSAASLSGCVQADQSKFLVVGQDAGGLVAAIAVFGRREDCHQFLVMMYLEASALNLVGSYDMCQLIPEQKFVKSRIRKHVTSSSPPILNKAHAHLRLLSRL